MVSNCGAGEGSWEFLGLQGDQISQSKRQSTLNIHCKDRCWSWSSNTLVTWCEELTHRKRPWCWERLRAGGEQVAEDEMVRWHHWLNGHELSKFWETVKDREAWCAAVYGVSKNRTQLSNWTITTLPVIALAHLPHMTPTQLTLLPSQTAWTRVGPPNSATMACMVVLKKVKANWILWNVNKGGEKEVVNW